MNKQLLLTHINPLVIKYKGFEFRHSNQTGALILTKPDGNSNVHVASPFVKGISEKMLDAIINSWLNTTSRDRSGAKAYFKLYGTLEGFVFPPRQEYRDRHNLRQDVETRDNVANTLSYILNKYVPKEDEDNTNKVLSAINYLKTGRINRQE